MVIDKTNCVSPKTTSPVRSSTRIRAARFIPTARETPVITKPSPRGNLNLTSSTIYKLNVPGQTHDQNTGIVRSQSCHPHLLQGLYRGGGTNIMSTLQRNEKSVLDKVEDMDVDSQSDHEGACLGEKNVAKPSSSSSFESNAAGLVKENSCENNTEDKNCIRGKEPKKNSANELSQSGVKMRKRTHEAVSKKKPVYITFHASLLRIGGMDGRALKPVRIQAGKILIEMELQSSNKQKLPVETFRIPCKELLVIKVNLVEPPFLFVAVLNKRLSKTLIDGSKNGLMNKSKGIEKLELVVHLMYDIIADNLRNDFNSFRSEVEKDVRWEEISATKARRILNGEDSSTEETISKEDTRKDSLVEDGKKENDVEEKCETESKNVGSKNTVRNSLLPPKVSEHGVIINTWKELEEPVPKRRRKITDNETIEKLPEKPSEERKRATEEKPVSKTKEEIKTDVVKVLSEDEPDTAKTPSSSRRLSLNERSFEENRLDARRIFELENNVAEKERMLSQQRRTVELRDLQLQQERDAVRQLRASLREEQRKKRDLEERHEVVNSELLVRNAHEAIGNSRISELEQELSELNLSLSSSRTENQRLVQEIHQIRDQVTEHEESLRTERERVATFQHEIETQRTTLESLRDDIRQKDLTLSQEREQRVAASERNSELERQLQSTRTEYEERIARSNDEHARTQQEHEECNRLLVSTREQLEDANRALHRAQETVDEYSRMQPRDWTISRDEIVITENVLGHGAWGWVKEGRFRGTMVAVKQMHELIVSSHNRRLFEREMQIAARCRHPNLLQFIGATSDNGLALLVTELLDADLRSVLEQRSLCHDEVVTIATDVSRALNYLHLNKPFPIIHRDISSTNVLLWKRENAYHAKLSDYGAANFLRQCMTVSPGASIYAAPEAVTSRQSTKVDVYSFGLLLCEMCIRELPVPGHTYEQIRLMTNAHLRELVQRSTNETPENRPTMAEALTALLRLRPNSALGVVSINNRHTVV